MGQNLEKRLRTSHFEGAHHQALLAIVVIASEFRTASDRFLGKYDLTTEQYNILRILQGQPEGHPCGEVAVRMVDRSPDITRRIDTLERLGLVERERSVEDRRVVMTRITDRGTMLLAKVAPEFTKYVNEWTASLTDEEAAQVADLCDKLINVRDESELLNTVCR